LRGSFGAGLHRALAPGFKIFENLQACFAQTLFVFGRPRFGCGDIGAGFFQGAFGSGTTFRQDCGEGLMHQHGVEEIKDRQKDGRGYGSEQ
jgi:hypothetical protein